jgi:hypothetical protein
MYSFKVPNPNGQPAEGVASRQLWLRKKLVAVAWQKSIKLRLVPMA